MASCLDLVQRNIEDFTQQELDEVLAEIAKRQSKLVKRGMDTTTAASKAAQDVAARLRAAAAIEKRNAAINARVRAELLDTLRATWMDDPAEGVRSILISSQKARFGSRDSAMAMQSAKKRQYLSGITADLEKAGLKETFVKGDMEADIYEARWAISKGDEEKLKTLPTQAVEIAKIMAKWQEVARLDANRAGAWIGKLDSYVHTRVHNPDAMQKAGREAWVADIKERLDLDRMFPDGDEPDNIDDWLSEAWTNIVTGVRPERGDIAAERMTAFQGPGNLAKSLSAERVIHLKSARDELEYNQKFGAGRLHEIVLGDLMAMADKTGLMMQLGTNPWHNFDAVVKAMRTELRNQPEALAKFDAKTQNGIRLKQDYDTVSGAMNVGAMSGWAKGVYVFNQVQTITTLGGSMVTSLADLGTRASLLKSQGMGFFDSLGNGLVAPVMALAKGADSSERRALAASLGALDEFMLGNIASRFDTDESLPGRLHKGVATFFKWNLQTWWTDTMRRSTLQTMGYYWGNLATDREWANLSDVNRRAMERFKIGEGEWNVIRKGLETDSKGRSILSPVAVREMDVREFADLAAGKIEALKRGVAARIQKRLLQDQKEAEWTDGRVTKLNERLDKMRARMADRLEKLRERRELENAERVDRAADRAVAKQERVSLRAYDQIGKIEKSIAGLQKDLEAYNTYWRYGVKESDTIRDHRYDRADGFITGKRVIGFNLVSKGEAQEALKSLTKRIRDLDGDLKRVHKELDDEVAALMEKGDNVARREIDSLRKTLRLEMDEVEQRLKQELADFIDGSKLRMRAREEASIRDAVNIEPTIRRILQDTREDVANRLQNFYSDELDSAIITPDASTRSFMYRGQNVNSTLGMALRLFWKFKSYGIAYFQRSLMREWYGNGNRGMARAAGLAQLMVATTAFGYVAMQLKALLAGKQPRPSDDYKTWMAAMAQGGALGIYGDFLFGQSRYGQSFLATVGGPAVSKADQAYQLFQSAKQGQDVGAQAWRMLYSSTVPGNNLFYSKWLTDYLFLYSVQEALNPGYLERMEQRMERETGQAYWLRPSEVVN